MSDSKLRYVANPIVIPRFSKVIGSILWNLVLLALGIYIVFFTETTQYDFEFDGDQIKLWSQKYTSFSLTSQLEDSIVKEGPVNVWMTFNAACLDKDERQEDTGFLPEMTSDAETVITFRTFSGYKVYIKSENSWIDLPDAARIPDGKPALKASIVFLPMPE